MQAARYGVFVFDDGALQDEAASRESAIVFYHPPRTSPQMRSVVVSLAAAIHQFAGAATHGAPGRATQSVPPGANGPSGKGLRARVLTLTSLKLAFQPLPPSHSLVLVVAAADRDPDDAVLDMLWRVFKGIAFFSAESASAPDPETEPPVVLTAEKVRATLQSHLRPLLEWYSRSGLAGTRGYVASALPWLPGGAVEPKLLVQSCQLMREFARVLEAQCAVLLWDGRVLATTMPHDLALLVASAVESWHGAGPAASQAGDDAGASGGHAAGRDSSEEFAVRTCSWNVTFSGTDLPPPFRTSTPSRGSTKMSLPAVPLPLIRQTSTASECALTSDSRLIALHAPSVGGKAAPPASGGALAGLVAAVIVPSAKLHMAFFGDNAAAEARAAASLESFMWRAIQALRAIPVAGGAGTGTAGAGGSPNRDVTKARGGPTTPTRLARPREASLGSRHPSRHRSISFNAVSYKLSESSQPTRDALMRRPPAPERHGSFCHGNRMLAPPEGGLLDSESPRSEGRPPTPAPPSPADVQVYNGRRYRFATWCETTQTFSVRLDHPATTSDPAVAAFVRHLCTSRDAFARRPSITQISKHKGQFTYFARQAIGQNIFAQILNPPPPSTEQFVREALEANHGIHFL